VVLFSDNSYCKTISANSSGSLKGWFQVSFPLVPGGVTPASLWLLFPTTSNISEDHLTVAFANSSEVGPSTSTTIPQVNDLISKGPGFWTCSLLGAIGTLGVASRIGVQAITTALPDVPALADVEDVTDIVVNAQVDGAQSAIPTSDGQVDADFKTLNDAKTGIEILKTKGIKATIEEFSKNEIQFTAPDVGSALDIASELSSDGHEASTLINLAKNVGCHF
jgi:hypothetical protein